MPKKVYCVYKHIFPNNKVYIGITCRKPEYRWNNGKGYANKQRKMYNAIQKYGWLNIKHEILYEGLTKEEAEQKEIELIKEYNSTNDNFGYNIEKGGGLNKEITEETRKLMIKNHKGKLGLKLSDREKKEIGIRSKKRWENMEIQEREYYTNLLKTQNIGRTSWNKGLHFSKEAKLNMSIAQKKRYKNGYISTLKGKHLTLEHKKRISEAKKGGKPSFEARKNMKEHNANAKKIIILETKQIFNSGKECAEFLGCHRCSPNFACNGIQKTCKGFHLMWLDEYNQRNSTIANTLGDLIC